MKKKTVLVTGAHGFMGRNISKYFAEKGYDVTGVGHGNWQGEKASDWGIKKWYEADVNSDFLKKIKISFDVLVHCAGSSSVSYSILHPEEDFKKNVLSILSVLEYLRSRGLKTRLIYPSSPAVYGNKEDIQIKESDLLDPISPYGYHKKIVEELCQLYSKQYGLNISIIRFFSFYGVGLKKQLIWDACEKINNSHNGKIEFYGTGGETRDWIHINDACRLAYKICKSKNKYEILNGASGKRVEIKKIIEILVKNSNKKIQIVFNRRIKPGDPKYYWADISKSKKLGWKQNVKLEDGLKGCFDYYNNKLNINSSESYKI